MQPLPAVAGMNHDYDLLNQFSVLFHSRSELFQQTSLFVAGHNGFAERRVSLRTGVARAFSLAWIISLRLR